MTVKMMKLLGSAVILSAVAAAAQAGTVTFVTPTGATESGGNPVNARADFTTGAGTVTIQLQNLLVNPTTIAQNLSDITFTLSTGQSSGTLASSSGQERTIGSNGTFTSGSVVPTGWVVNVSSLHVNGLGTASFVPAHTIVGLPNTNNVYSNANGSIAGNGPHNPYLAGIVTFTLSVTGVTAASNVSGATFSFGTSGGNNVAGTPGPTPAPVPVPLPSAAWAGLVMLGGLGVLRAKRLRDS